MWVCGRQGQRLARSHPAMQRWGWLSPGLGGRAVFSDPKEVSGLRRQEHRRQPILCLAGQAPDGMFRLLGTENPESAAEAGRLAISYGKGIPAQPPPHSCVPLCKSSTPCMDKQKQAQASWSRFQGSGGNGGAVCPLCKAGSGCPLTLGPNPDPRPGTLTKSEIRKFPELHQCRHARGSPRACPAPQSRGSAQSVSVQALWDPGRRALGQLQPLGRPSAGCRSWTRSPET